MTMNNNACEVITDALQNKTIDVTEIGFRVKLSVGILY